MLKQLQSLILMLSARGQQRADQNLVRRVLAMTAGLVRRPAEVAQNLQSLQKAYDRHAEEAASWVEPAILAKGGGGPFDACDLRHWLALAERAGVPFVPATEILSLTDEEMALASGQVEIPDNPVSRGIRKRIKDLPEFANLPASESEAPAVREAKMEALRDRLFAAMDQVPELFMIRSNRCGSEDLKALVGSGLAGPEVPEVRFGPDLEVGPGWVREGNRRRVHPSDHRTVMMSAQGPGGAVFLARPWMVADRYIHTEDPHRHGTSFEGKGIWPAEWRAFIEAGRVVGVAVYYPWTGETTSENARIALDVRKLAQRVADQAAKQKAWPRFMDIELLRTNENPKVKDNPQVQAILGHFGRETVSGTLDFLEVKGQGLMLLEGGPANTPFGGGHPCAFAGCGGPPRAPNKTITEGVAFKLMPGVLLGDPSTWNEGGRAGRILSWDDVVALAARPEDTLGEAPERLKAEDNSEAEISTLRF